MENPIWDISSSKALSLSPWVPDQGRKKTLFLQLCFQLEFLALPRIPASSQHLPG